MSRARSHAQTVSERVRKSGAQKVKVAVTDIDGVLRGKYIHIDKFLSALETGFGFCNVVFGWDSADVCYDNAQYTGWHTGYPDANVRLDARTYREVPWDNSVPFMLGDFVDAAPAFEARAGRARSGGFFGVRVARIRVLSFSRNSPVARRKLVFGSRTHHAGHVRIFTAQVESKP